MLESAGICLNCLSSHEGTLSGGLPSAEAFKPKACASTGPWSPKRLVDAMNS